MQKDRKDRINRIVFLSLLVVYFALCWFLYMKQISMASLGRFESDTAVHISFAVEDHYYHSFAAFIYVFLNLFPGLEYSASFVLAFMTAGAVYFTSVLVKKVFKEYGEEPGEAVPDVIAFAANLVMGFYLGFVNRKHYIGYESANMWHNSTYIFMRFFAILTLIYFLKIYRSYRDGLKAGDWVAFSVLLALTTGFKPSFFTVFAPFMALILLYDLIKGTRFVRILAFGSTVFTSLAVLLWQSLVLFGDTEDSGYAIAPFEALKARGEHPKVTLVLSVLFPLLVFALHLKDFYKDRIYTGGLVIGFIGFMEVFLLTETGARSEDSNFFWGYSIALFVVFSVSMIRAFRCFKVSLSRFRIPVFVLETAVLLWHVISGVWYFALLLTGVSYFV